MEQPKRKKRRVSKDASQEEGEKDGTAKESRVKEIATTPTKKRMTEKSSPKPRKKRKLNTNIRDYITCRRWREEDLALSKDQPSVTQEEQPHDGDCEPGPGQEEQPHDGDCEPVREARAQEGDEEQEVRVRARAGEEGQAGEEGPRTPSPPATPGDVQQDVQHLHHHPEGTPTGEEEISCEISMHARMPASIVQASTGGIGPRGKTPIVETNENELSEDEPREQDDPQEAGEEMQGQGDDHQPQGAGIKRDCKESNQPQLLSREQEDPLSGQKLLEAGEERQEDDHQQQGVGEEISCEISMHSRMPGPNVQASQGGIGPNTPSKTSFSNIIQFKRLRQPTLRWNMAHGEQTHVGDCEPGLVQEEQPHDDEPSQEGV